MKTAWGSLAISVMVLGLKLAAWWVTLSVALYSDALETVINVVAACAALIALRISSKPPDADHPYGHQKAEYFSAVLEGMMVIGAAAAILHEVYTVWWHLEPLKAPLQGMLINGVATVVNAVWAAFLIRSGRKWRSPAILASGRHVLTDVWTSGGVLVGFALVPLTGWAWLDPAIAAVVAINIIWTGFAMVRDSVGSLMDKAVEPSILGAIRQIISCHALGALEAHDLRTRTSGHVTFIEFHLVVPRHMSLEIGARYLRPAGKGTARRSWGSRNHNSCRTRAQGQASRRHCRLDNARQANSNPLSGSGAGLPGTQAALRMLDLCRRSAWPDAGLQRGNIARNHTVTNSGCWSLMANPTDRRRTTNTSALSIHFLPGPSRHKAGIQPRIMLHRPFLSTGDQRCPAVV